MGNNMKICSIDPGLSGSIIIYEESNDIDKKYHILYNYKIKNDKGKNELDTESIINFLKEHQPECAIIEQQIAIPQQSAVATGTTMKNYGIFLGILSALNIPYTIVFSRTWMKYFVGKFKYTVEGIINNEGGIDIVVSDDDAEDTVYTLLYRRESFEEGTVLQSEYLFDYTGEYQTFTAPIIKNCISIFLFVISIIYFFD